MTVDSTDQTASHGQQAGAAGALPRPDEVARAEQLGAHVVGDDELAGEHAVEHEQADVVGARAGEPRDVPRADRQPVRADDELALGLVRGGRR